MWNKSIKGEIGEVLAAAFLSKKGFSILSRNYRKKLGEIDIIAKKGTVTHFIEVKLVTHEINSKISRETLHYRPEERVNREKIKKISRTGELYLVEKGEFGSECTVSVVAIIVDPKTRKAHCRFIENVL